MIDLSVRRPVATACLYAALLALGAWSFRHIPVELLPDVSFPRLTVTATWSGASPEAMEALVTAPLEAAVQQVGSVRKVVSTSRADQTGAGAETEIEVEFAREARMEFARLELGERLAALREELPPGVDPVVSPYVPPEFAEEQVTFLSWRLSGPYTHGRLAEIGRQEVGRALEALDGVAAVAVRGGEERELSVELDGERLAAFGLRPTDVWRAIAEHAAPRAPGAVELDGRRRALAVRAPAGGAADLERAVVEARPEGPLRVGDLGRVRDGTAEPVSYHRIDGRPAVTLELYRQAGTNAVRVADAAKARVAELDGRLPPGVRVELDRDASEDIRAQLGDLRVRALVAAGVILLVLGLFLRSLGAVLVVFATIGFSVLIAVNLLYVGGFSLNVLTLAGLAWGFGLVVDNGIVVLENVERHRRSGRGREEAAREGARQVALPVLAATLTTAIVLVPFLFFQGELRLYYVPLAWAVGFAILASLLVAFTFVPALTARVARAEAAPAVAAGAGTADGPRQEPGYIRAYRGLLGLALDHPVMVALLCLACLGGSWWLFDRQVTRDVPWRSFWGESTFIAIQISFPRGTGLERTDALARSFEGRLATLPEIDRYETRVFPRFAYIRVTFPPELARTAVPVAIKEQLVAYSYGFSGAEVRVYGYGPSFYGGGGSPPNYRLKVLGYNYLAVQGIAEELAGRLRRFSRIRDVDPNASGRWYERDKEFEYFVRPDRGALGAAGLTVEEALDFVSAHLRGGPAGRLRLTGEEIRWAVKVVGWEAFDLLQLQDLRVPAPNGAAEVRLASVSEVGRRDVLSRIRREDQQYERSVAWEFRGPRKLGDLVRDAVVEAMELPPGYRIERDDRWRWPEEEKRQVWWVIAFAVLLVYMVTAGLFESLRAPLVVLLTLPLALIGVFLIFFYADATFTRTAYIGVVMMGGIVVNNAILVVYHIGELRARLPDREAILRGTLERVRPILMTTLTTVGGLLPLVMFAGHQDENIWNALALATIGGLLSSTLFVLVAIPVAYRFVVVGRERGRARA